MTTQKATPCEFSEGHCIHCGDSEQSCAFAECEGWINPGDVIALMRAEITRLQYDVDAVPAIKAERDALTSDNDSLHRQLERWQGIAVERVNERDAALEQNTQLDARCAKLEAAGKLALEALEVATTPLATDRQEVLEAITALRQAGVQ